MNIFFSILFYFLIIENIFAKENTTTKNDTTFFDENIENTEFPKILEPNDILCVECAIGTFKPKGALKSECTSNCSAAGECAITFSQCMTCPLGYFGNETGLGSCYRCANGTYTDQAGQAECLDCLAGTTNNGLWTQCVPCPSGTVNPHNASVCEPCQMGRYADADALQCKWCKPGTASSHAGSAACEPCAPGSYTSGEGAVGCNACTHGYYCPANGVVWPTICPKDHFCVTGTVDPRPCPLLYGADKGSSHCAPSASFYLFIMMAVAAVVGGILCFVLRAVRKRERMGEQLPLLSSNDNKISPSLSPKVSVRGNNPSKMDSEPIYQGL